MASSKVFMRGPEHSLAQPGDVLTLLHGPGRPRKWDLGPHWSWHWTCPETAQQRDSREPRNVGRREPVLLQGCQSSSSGLHLPRDLMNLETLCVMCVVC